MAHSTQKQPQRLSEALEEHYQQLLAETKTKSTPATPATLSSYSLARLSPTSTSSTASDASSSSSSSHSQTTSPSLSPRDPTKRLTALDDDTEVEEEADDGVSVYSSSSSASSNASTSSSSSSSLAHHHTVPASRLPLPTPTARVDSLLTLCTLHLASHLDSLDSLARLPEDVVQQLLYLTIMRSGMTPTLAKLFAASGHESVVRWVEDNLDLSAVYVTSTKSCREKF